MSLSDGSLCCYKERGCYRGWGFSGGTPGSSGRVRSSARSQNAPLGGFAVLRKGTDSSASRKGTDSFAKGHGFIRAMRCATNSFLVAFRPCLVPQPGSADLFSKSAAFVFPRHEPQTSKARSALPCSTLQATGDSISPGRGDFTSPPSRRFYIAM
jgi:hypothetical protein